MTGAPRIYTRLGDDGTTGLLFGGRISKSGPLMEAVGAIDETVAALGVARASTTNQKLTRLLLMIQRHLFVATADVVCNPAARARLEPGISLVTGALAEEVERAIDEAVAGHPLTTRFVVPGGNFESAALDVARTALRRAERRVLALEGTRHPASREVRTYMNRASDLLYVLARAAADTGPEEMSHS